MSIEEIKKITKDLLLKRDKASRPIIWPILAFASALGGVLGKKKAKIPRNKEVNIDNLKIVTSPPIP